MREGRSCAGLVIGAPWQALGGHLVEGTLLSAGEPVPTAFGDIAELRDVDVDQGPGMIVLG